MNNICFIMGIPRSGTTLVWGLLESHTNTIPFLSDHLDGSMEEILPPYRTSESAVYFREPEQAHSLLTNFGKHHNPKLVIEKTPAHIKWFAKIVEDFPEARIIVTDRAPFSVFKSLIKFAGFDVIKARKMLSKYTKRHEGLVNNWKDRILFVNFHQLLANPYKGTTEIYKYVGLSLDEVDNAVQENSRKTKVVSQRFTSSEHHMIVDSREFYIEHRSRLKGYTHLYHKRWAS